MKTIHDKLRMLNVLVTSVAYDIEQFLEEPGAYDPAEYFADTLTAANEAQDLVVEIRSEITQPIANRPTEDS